MKRKEILVSSTSTGLRVVLCGDVMPDARLEPPAVLFLVPQGTECLPGAVERQRFPFVNSAASRRWLADRGIAVDGVVETSHAPRCLPLDEAHGGRDGFSLAGMTTWFNDADAVFVNLECPLTVRGRRAANDMCYRAVPSVAGVLAQADVSVVSLANNHCMDYGPEGLFDTLEALRREQIETVGAGENLSDARRPAILRTARGCVAFLGYSQVGSPVIFATDGESGCAPMNEMVAVEDISALRGKVDLVVVSLHWGEEGRLNPADEAVAFAHRLIEAGADVIVGHHPHVPGGIEWHREGLALYSLGNFAFGHHHRYWTEGVVAVVQSARGPSSVEILPTSYGLNPSPAQPFDALSPLRGVVSASRRFGTDLRQTARGLVSRRP